MSSLKKFGLAMNIKLIMTILIACSLGGISLAQSGGKIVGKVTDKESGQPLLGSNVLVQNLDVGDASDEKGEFIILNVPSGTYNVEARMVGYQTQIIKGVKVVTGLTTHLDFQLGTKAVELNQVEVTAYKNPAIQADLTSKVQARTSSELSQQPITSIKDVLTQEAGVVAHRITSPVSSLPVFGQYATVPQDGLHFRGGRENETAYLFDGINVRDAVWGDFNLDQVSEELLSSMETRTGTFDPQYGEAMSGVVQLSPFDEIPSSVKFSLKAFTDKLDKKTSENTYSYDFMISAPVPFYKNLAFMYANRTYSTDGYIYGYIYPNFVNSEGTDKSGTPTKVPMQYQDNEFNFAKMIWQPFSSLKLSLGGFLGKTHQGLYNHYFKYDPYGTPRIWKKDNLGYLKINYVINNRSFVNISLANYERRFDSYVWPNFDNYAIRTETGNGEFQVTGEDYVYFNTFFNRKEIQLDYTLQATKIHNISAGGSVNFLKTDLARINPNGGAALENYNYKPLHIGGELKDKMEFDEMGLIINLGARLDYFNNNRQVLDDIHQLTDLSAPMEKEKPILYVTPRLGVSFPIAKEAAIRFGYGHYYQYPNYYEVFEGTYYLQATGQYRPNPQIQQAPLAMPNIKQEETVDYEFGLQTQLSNTISLDVTAFYRKSRNLIGTVTTETEDGKRFSLFQNTDYATVKGIEFSLKKRLSDHFSAFFNYTLSKTLVSTSIFFNQPTDESRTFPADWDQPSVFQGNVYYESDAGYGFSLYGSISSGLPYTRSRFDPNGARAPMLHELTLEIFKNFDLFGFNQQIFIQVENLTNDKNIYWVYSDSGIPGSDANPATSYDYTNDPTEYGPGRVIQFGIKIGN